MNVNRSVSSIHDLNVFTPPVQVPTDKIPGRIRPNGYCQVCGDRETLTAELARKYRGERECERYDCELVFAASTFAECTCCGEVLIKGTVCWAYTIAWDAACEARFAARQAAA